MKPRTKFQQSVVAASKHLPPLTPAQIEWGYKNCIEHIGRRTPKGLITCTECGHTWQSENGELTDNLLGCECPHCHTTLKVETTLRRKFNDYEYLCIVTRCKGFQVLRFAVTGVDRDGNIQTADPTDQNVASLLNVNTQDSALEAFFKKFMEQAQNPVHTGIFVMTENALNKLIRIDFDPEILENYRIDPSERLQTQEQRQFEPLDVTKIDLADMEKKGIRMEDIEPHLKAMSYGHKSNGLVEMNPELENGMRVSTKGRVSLEEQADGSLRVVPHYWQERPDLDAPFHGVLLDEEAKTNLMNTRHAGKVIDLELEPGKLTPCYVSIDKWTNTLEPMPVSLLEKRARIKEADLSEGKQMDFYGGGKVLLEGYTTRAGYKRDAYIQIDAAERNYSFTYDGLDRNRYAQENKEIYRQKAAEKNGRQETAASERQPTLTIHRTILKASVPKEAYDQWTEAVNDPSKRADVKAFYIKGMVKDGQGEPFNAWVKPNFERNKMDFFRWNPDRAKRQGAEVKPAVESRTQVAVNSEGKTVEAVKGVKEPLKQGQQEATPTQKKNYRSSKKSNSKGVKV